MFLDHCNISTLFAVYAGGFKEKAGAPEIVDANQRAHLTARSSSKVFTKYGETASSPYRFFIMVIHVLLETVNNYQMGYVPCIDICIHCADI